MLQSNIWEPQIVYRRDPEDMGVNLPPTGKDEYQKWFQGQIVAGTATPENISEYFAKGGSVDQLIKLVSTGSLQQQQRAATRTQQEQLGLRQALLGGGGQNAIQGILGQQAFNPYQGPQELQGNPLQGVDFASVFGMQGAPQAEQGLPGGGLPGGGQPPIGGQPPLGGDLGGVLPPGLGEKPPDERLPTAAGPLPAPGGLPQAPLPGAPTGGQQGFDKNLQAFLQAIKGRQP